MDNEQKIKESYVNPAFEGDMETGGEISSDKPVITERNDPYLPILTDVKEKPPFSELSTRGKIVRILWDWSCRYIVLLGVLYLFICSIGFLSSAFSLLGGKEVGEVFKNNEILRNPVAGLMMGVLGTVLVQSSSTTSSVVVTMVAAEIISVKNAIYVIMGANIGTSVTNTIVSLGQISKEEQFRRAFAGATVHDMFNWLTVIILLPLEAASGYLHVLSEAIIKSTNLEKQDLKRDMLKVITKPFTSLVISVDKKVINKMAKFKNFTPTTIIKNKGNFMFKNVVGVWSDKAIGAVLLVLALIMMIICLICIVKLLQSILQGQVAKVIHKFVNSDFPGIFAFLTGYVAIIIGAGATIVVQSSSIFTSSITPLVGVGVITIYRMYPLTLGANIGTTFTSILAALSVDKEDIPRGLQISMCHLFFNITGIVIWYPFPFMRKVPIAMAKHLGNTTAKYRWFAFVYLFLVFFIMPAAVFGLSLAGWYVLVGVASPMVLLAVIITIIKIIQKRCPSCLPTKLRTWKWLPIWLRSLKPYDRFFRSLFFCFKVLQMRKKSVPVIESETQI